MKELFVEIIDLRVSRDSDLLREVYEKLYLACFTDPDEQEDLEQYRERLFDPQKPTPQPRTHFLVAGESLNDPAHRVLGGMLIYELYQESSCGLLTYIAVNPAGRGRGLGRRLVRQAIDSLTEECQAAGGHLRGVFAETHDPRLIDPAEDAMSPRDRIEVMKRLGSMLIPVRYVQPELRPGDGRSRKLLLLAFPMVLNETPHVSGDALLDFMHEFYRALGVANPSQDPDFLTIRQDVENSLQKRTNPQSVQTAADLEMPIARWNA